MIKTYHVPRYLSGIYITIKNYFNVHDFYLQSVTTQEDAMEKITSTNAKNSNRKT